MYFKDLKPGYTVYIYNQDAITVECGKVNSVTPPHFDTRNALIGAKMVVDVAVACGDKVTTYTFREDSDTGYANSLMITTDRLNVVREVEMGKQLSEQLLSQVDEHKSRIQKYSSILADFDPTIKEKQVIDERFVKLESSINDIKSMLSNITILKQ